MTEGSMTKKICGMCGHVGKDVRLYEVEIMIEGRYLTPRVIFACNDRDACITEKQCKGLTPFLLSLYMFYHGLDNY